MYISKSINTNSRLKIRVVWSGIVNLVLIRFTIEFAYHNFFPPVV